MYFLLIQMHVLIVQVTYTIYHCFRLIEKYIQNFLWLFESQRFSQKCSRGLCLSGVWCCIIG